MTTNIIIHKLHKSLILCGILSLPITSQAMQVITLPQDSTDLDTPEAASSDHTDQPSSLEKKLDAILQAIQEQNALLEEQHTTLKKICEYQVRLECAHCFIRFEYDTANDSFRLVLENFGLASYANNFRITLPPKWEACFLKDSIKEWGLLLPHQRVTIAETPKGSASAVAEFEKETPLHFELKYDTLDYDHKIGWTITTSQCPEWRKHLSKRKPHSQQSFNEESENNSEDD